MRYMAYRIRTGEWLSKDLPNISDVEIAEVLSGPGRLNFAVQPELRYAVAKDGMRILEDWATMVLAVDEDSWEIIGHGIVVPPTQWEDERARITCAGVSAYTQGFAYEKSTIWGPQADANGIITQARPDPVRIVYDLWDYVQSFPNSDLNVTVTGADRSDQRIGTNEEPYRLRWWEMPDVGREIDNLATETPFDYEERAYWVDDDHEEVRFEVVLGWPRLGTERSDLSFKLGVNITAPSAPESVEEYGNNFIGIGNGEESDMTTATLSVDDGRLRRTRYITDKTIKDADRLYKHLQSNALVMGSRIRIGEIPVRDHRDARLSNIRVGDDIYVDTFTPAYGDVRLWCRVLEKVRGEDPFTARLAVEASASYLYNPANPTSLLPNYQVLWKPPVKNVGSGGGYSMGGDVNGAPLPAGTQPGDLLIVGIIRRTDGTSYMRDPRITRKLINTDVGGQPVEVWCGRATENMNPLNIGSVGGDDQWDAGVSVWTVATGYGQMDVRDVIAVAKGPGEITPLPGIADTTLAGGFAVCYARGGIGGAYDWYGASPRLSPWQSGGGSIGASYSSSKGYWIQYADLPVGPKPCPKPDDGDVFLGVVLGLEGVQDIEDPDGDGETTGQDIGTPDPEPVP